VSNISATLQTARRALLAQQAAIAVTSDNIANVNTPGYARRRGDISPGPIIQTTEGGFGTGAEMQNIQSVRDIFVERQLLRVTGEAARYSMSDTQLGVAEATLGSLSDSSLASALDNFWASWQTLADDPTSRGARSVVQQAGNDVANRFNSIGRNLDAQTTQINEMLIQKIDRVNSLLSRLTDLNQQNVGTISSGELDDGRIAIMDELAKLTGATFRQRDDGTFAVSIGGFSVAEGGQTRLLRYELDSKGDVVLLPLVDGAVPLHIEAGEIAGLMDTRDTYIADLRTELDQLAVTLTTEVNALHTTGYDQNGASAGNFFNPNCTGIGNLAISEAIAKDPSKIAASSNGQTGDNSLALALADLELQPLIDGTETINEAFTSLVSNFGAKIEENRMMNDAAQASLQQMTSWRESVSGVSLNEEMSKLIQYENAFNAAAKLTQTISEMMDIILTLR